MTQTPSPRCIAQSTSVGLSQPWRIVRITRQDLREGIHALVQEERLRTADALDERGDVNGNTGVLTLTATSGGAQLAQSAQYDNGGSNYNPNDMYFPFSITFVLPAGQSGQIQLTGGENNLGCGSFMYSLYAL